MSELWSLVGPKCELWSLVTWNWMKWHLRNSKEQIATYYLITTAVIHWNTTLILEDACRQWHSFHSQDDRMIQRTWGERFRLNRRHLKIRSVRLSDSGVIVCKGVNGFGSQSVALDLVVRGRKTIRLARLFLPLFLWRPRKTHFIVQLCLWQNVLIYNPIIVQAINAHDI